METYVFRHGESPYKQGKVSLSEAYDLTNQGISVVRDSTKDLSDRLKQGLPVQIHSSPFGRCLHTAKIIGQTLSEDGHRVSEVREDELIGEVGNFDWSLFCPLVTGGDIEYEGERFRVDKALTNPQNVSSVRYFREDLAHRLSDQAKRTLPLKYQKRIASFERYPSIADRLNLKLESLKNRNGEVQIISTHEGLTGRFIEQLTGQNEAFLGRGKYFGVKTEGGILIPCAYQTDAILTEQ